MGNKREKRSALGGQPPAITNYYAELRKQFYSGYDRLQPRTRNKPENLNQLILRLPAK